MFIIKVLLDHSMRIQLCIVYNHFGSIVAELNSCEREHMVCKA